MNKGGSHGGTVAYGSGTGTENFGKPLTSMTVGEVLSLGSQGKIHAAGRYQFIHDTLKEQVSKLGIKPTQMFDASMQDYLTLSYMRDNPTAWVGVNTKDPGSLSAIRQVNLQPLPPAPWMGTTDPRLLMADLKKNNLRSYNTIMNEKSTPNQVRAALNDVWGRTAGRISMDGHVYTTGNLGYGSTGDHVDIKPVAPGGVYADRSLPITRTELDAYVAVDTDAGLLPISQAMTMTASDQDHRNRARSSHGIDFAAKPNREIYLTNGARVIENYVDNSARGQGSHRLLIETPDGKRYAFIHGTSTIPTSN